MVKKIRTFKAFFWPAEWAIFTLFYLESFVGREWQHLNTVLLNRIVTTAFWTVLLISSPFTPLKWTLITIELNRMSEQNCPFFSVWCVRYLMLVLQVLFDGTDLRFWCMIPFRRLFETFQSSDSASEMFVGITFYPNRPNTIIVWLYSATNCFTDNKEL